MGYLSPQRTTKLSGNGTALTSITTITLLGLIITQSVRNEILGNLGTCWVYGMDLSSIMTTLCWTELPVCWGVTASFIGLLRGEACSDPPPPPTICMFPLRSRLSTDCRTAEPCWVCFWIWRPSCTLIPRLQHQSGQQEASWSCGGGAPAGKQSERCNAAERSGTAGSGACRARPSSVDKNTLLDN